MPGLTRVPNGSKKTDPLEPCGTSYSGYIGVITGLYRGSKVQILSGVWVTTVDSPAQRCLRGRYANPKAKLGPKDFRLEVWVLRPSRGILGTLKGT